MTAISWKNAVNGNWNVAANWSLHCHDQQRRSANTLTFDASALYENAGSLTMAGALTVDSGFVSLNEANTIGSVALWAACSPPSATQARWAPARSP
jgi:hypothetical protein